MNASVDLLQGKKTSVKYWRMTFRYGTDGEPLWKHCFEHGIAAIGEFNDDGLPLPDLTHIDRPEFESLYDKGPFNGVTGRQSIRNIRYQMSPGDVIYAKEEDKLVGCGIVVSFYQYDPNIMSGTVAEWSHFVRVKWDKDFQPTKDDLGAPRITLLRLDKPDDPSKNRLPALESLLKESGQVLRRETDWYYKFVMGQTTKKD